MNLAEESVELHKKLKGKMEIASKVKVDSKHALSVAYTPGVAAVSKAIADDSERVYELTPKGNTVAVVSDGSAVLGLGDIGPKAAIPVMEGKAVLFKEFSGIDAIPITLDTKDVEEIIRTVKLIAPAFGGINLEDISAPRCFEIEDRLRKELDIPVMHDDQHGTAIVVLAGLINALKVVGKELNQVRIVFSGAGAAGIAITKMLLRYGAKDFILTDTAGAIYEGRKDNMNPMKAEMAKLTNPKKAKGTLAEVIKGADVFIGVSGPGVLTKEMVSSMAKDAIVFAMANPEPEIYPDIAKEAGAAVVATGRSDFPNQINNVLAFPGVFRGALDCRAKDITFEMKVAAAEALASLVEPTTEKIIPLPFDKGVAKAVAKAVSLC